MTAYEGLDVYVDIEGETVRVGRAQFHPSRGRFASTTFQYTPESLADDRIYSVDPALPVLSGTQHVTGLPGVFSDSAPDRWGRNLISKRMRALAVERGQPARGLDDVDYLAGVSDITRQGALRFRSREREPFLDPGQSVPRLVSLPELMRASEAAVRDGGEDALAAIKTLLDAGTGSLGGARPKAAVRGDDEKLLIAKFPHPDDAWDVIAWEATALDLARASGVAVPDYQLIRLEGRHVLLMARFDRAVGGERIGYMSAMTLLERRDGDEGDYVEIAEQLEEVGARVGQDLAELFRRAAFSVGLHNTDDHLRNHGLLRDRAGWVLSPAFDINPEPDVTARQTSIAGATTPEEEAEGLAQLARACRLRPREAREERERIADAIEGWRDAATGNGVSGGQIDLFAGAIGRGIVTLRTEVG